MSAPIGMITLGHINPDIASFLGQRHERPVGIRQSDAVFRRQSPNLPGMERQRRFRIEQVRC